MKDFIYDVPKPQRVRWQLYRHLIGAVRIKRLRWPLKGGFLPPGAMRKRLSEVFPSEFWHSSEGRRPDYAVFPWRPGDEGWEGDSAYRQAHERVRKALLGCAHSVHVQYDKKLFITQAKRLFDETGEGILVGAKIHSKIGGEAPLRREWIVRPCYVVGRHPVDKGKSQVFYFLGEKETCGPKEEAGSEEAWNARWGVLDDMLSEKVDALSDFFSRERPHISIRLFDLEDAVCKRQYWIKAEFE